MFFTPKPNPTAPQSLFYQQSQTPQKPFTQNPTHQTPPQTTPQNISVFLTPSPETSEPSSQNSHQLLSFLPCNPMPINHKEAKKKKPASQPATAPSLLLLRLSVPTRKTQQKDPKRTAASHKQKDLFFVVVVVVVVRLRSLRERKEVSQRARDRRQKPEESERHARVCFIRVSSSATD